jgi:Carboxypeptidase regulatory-like domain
MRTLILCGLILLLPISTFALLATGTVNGTVTDSDGKIVANQKVRIKKVLTQAPIGNDTGVKKPTDNLTVASLTTDKDGKFTQSLDAGQYWAEAGSKTLGYDKQKFEIKPGETTDVKLSLTKDDVQK